MASYIQVPYGYRHVSNPIQFLSPKNNEENHYFNRIGYISNKDDPVVKNDTLNAIKNRKDLQKWILATSDFGTELQRDINEITGGDENFNNAVLRRALDLKNNDLFRNPQPITLLFNNGEKFHQQNPIIGKLATQINVSNLTDKELSKRKFLEGGVREIEDRLHRLKYGKNDDDNNDDDDPKTPPGGGAKPQREAEAEMDPSFRRPTQDPEKDLEETFKQLRYGKIKPQRDLKQVFKELRFGKEANVDPHDTIQDKIIEETITPREDIGSSLPTHPLFNPEENEKKDSFSRPITRLIDGETIEVTPKTEIEEEKQLSDQLQNLFPNIEQETDNSDKADLHIDFENLSQTLSQIENKIVPFEFEFFQGGKNEKFREIIIGGIDSSNDTIDFINFLESKICQKILVENRLKIHIEIGNIYFDNNDTNESIHSFILAQVYPIAGEIDHQFTFDRDYVTYFQWITDAFAESKKNKFDIFTNKNAKFLFYHFNDYLEQNGERIKKVKHSTVTQDYIAAEQIQDKNWKYFVESLLSFSEKATDTSQNFLLDTQENLLILTKTHDELYDQIAKNFNTILGKMPFDLYSEIENDFLRESYEIEDVKNLDNWVSFYFKHGPFPGNNELTILPQTNLPKTVDNLSVDVSPLQLYNKFGKGDAKKLVSFQAIVALFQHYGGEKLTAKRAMDEWKENLTFQALSKENDNITLKFDYLAEIVFHFLRAFLTLESEFEEMEKTKKEILEKTIENLSSERIITSTPSSKSICRFFPLTIFNTPEKLNLDDSNFLKASLTMSKPNIDATIDAAEEKDRNVLQDITNPTPGLFVNQTFTNDDLNTMETDDDSKFKLSKPSMKRLSEITQNISDNINSIEENLSNNISFANDLKEKIEKINNENKKVLVEPQKKEIEILKSESQTKIKTSKEKKRIKPYNLRSSKRKFNTIDSIDSLDKPFLYTTSNENERNKIEAARKVFSSVTNNLPDHNEKLKFTLDSLNNIKIT